MPLLTPPLVLDTFFDQELVVVDLPEDERVERREELTVETAHADQGDQGDQRRSQNAEWAGADTLPVQPVGGFPSVRSVQQIQPSAASRQRFG